MTDNGGLTSPAVTRTITVPDFSISRLRPSRTILPGGSHQLYGDRRLRDRVYGRGQLHRHRPAVRRDPPRSVRPRSPAPGRRPSRCSTTTATPAGSYPFTITATSGPLSHAVTATLIVSPAGDFAIGATPVSRTIPNGATTTYSVTMTTVGAFQGAVNLSVTGLPKFVTARLHPPRSHRGPLRC